jgi:hypothetical protein
MNNPDPEPADSLSRREFFHLAALSTATAGLMPDMHRSII